MKFVNKAETCKSSHILLTITFLLLITFTSSQGIKDIFNEEALKHRNPGQDPRLLDIIPETKEEVDEALDDELETMNKDETKLSKEDELALTDLADGYNPMEDDSDASDTFQEYQDIIKNEEDDMEKPYGLFDLQSNSEQQHLLNFKKISTDFKAFQEKKLECLKKIPKEAWVLRELVLCVGRNFNKIKNDIKYERRKLLSRAESRVRRVMADECYSEAGLDLNQSRSCDIVERDALELLWDELNYPALLKYHREKYTFTHGKMHKNNFDKYLGFFAELYRRDSELLVEMNSHGQIALINIKKFIDDTTEHLAEEARVNGYEFNLDLAHAGIDSNNIDNNIQHNHFHAVGTYDPSFNHPNEENDYHDYNGDHKVTVENNQDYKQSAMISHHGGYKIDYGPSASNTNDIMDKYHEDEVSEESETSEEYAQRIKDLAGYVEPEEDGDEDHVVESKKFKYKKRNLKRNVNSMNRIHRSRMRTRNSHVKRNNSIRRTVRRLPDNRKIIRQKRQQLHRNVELKRIHQNKRRRKKSRNLIDKPLVKLNTKKSIAEILKDYTYKLPGLKSKKSLAHLLKV